MKKLLLVLFVSLFSISSSAAEKVKIVTSIKPLQLVLQELLQDLADVDVLIPAGASPHHYSLKPSDMRKLSQADLIVWVGPDLEQFLSRPLSKLNRPLLQLLEGEMGPDDHHEAEREEGHEGHHHHHGENDPHIWLDPLLMLEAATKVRNVLSQQYPELSSALGIQYEQFAANLLATDKAVSSKLSPYKDRGFVVFHDAFSLLVEHYSLNQLAYFTVDPGQAPGAKKLAQIQEVMKKEDAVCVFLEPQFEAAVVKRITQGLSVNRGHLDPLAIDITLQQGYSGYLQDMATRIENCLK